MIENIYGGAVHDSAAENIVFYSRSGRQAGSTKDYQQVMPMLDPDIVWIGVGEKALPQVAGSKKKVLQSNQRTYQKDRLESSDYQLTMISDTVCLVTGTFLFSEILGQI